jgi:NTP pyrophosphatase (non-canonical NTP hydrolase)
MHHVVMGAFQMNQKPKRSRANMADQEENQQQKTARQILAQLSPQAQWTLCQLYDGHQPNASQSDPDIPRGVRELLGAGCIESVPTESLEEGKSIYHLTHLGQLVWREYAATHNLAGQPMKKPGTDALGQPQITPSEPGFSDPARQRTRYANRLLDVLDGLHDDTRNKFGGVAYESLSDGQRENLQTLVRLGLAEQLGENEYDITPSGRNLILLGAHNRHGARLEMERLLEVQEEKTTRALELAGSKARNAQRKAWTAGPVPGLTFAQLREANTHRNTRGVWGGSIMDWTPTDWGNAMAGEAGEACNQIKKLRRMYSGVEWLEYIPSSRDEQLLANIADELADTVIYLDLLAARMGLNLAEATTRKFNRVSQEKGSGIMLPEPPAEPGSGGESCS